MNNKHLGILIFILLGLLGAILALYGAAHMSVPKESSFILELVLFITIATWLRRDSKNLFAGIPDIHYLLACLWPIVLPYHLWKSRGRKGLLLTVYGILLVLGIPIFLQILILSLAKRP